MSRHFVYNLSNIPDFNNAVKSGEINADYSKYYSVQQYFTKSNQKYSVIKYIKDFLCIDLIPTYGVCRSIIVNSQNKVVSFAPPKSIPSDRFIQSYNISNDIVAEEFVEGTMINVFWDPTIGLNGGWEIATRNTPGATSSFFKGSPNKTNKTFREMFLEAAEQNNLLFNMLNPVYCYSFVLQHPENRIVVPFKNPQLYLVEMYLIEYIDNSIFVNSFEPRSLLKEIFEVSNVTVQFPEIYTCTSYPDLIEKYASMNTSYNIVGVVLHNRVTGERAKIRNPVYEQVRNLRGNQPKLQYQYLSLRKEGKVSDFLKFYPENKKHFSEFRDQVHLFTNTLFDNYKACYIKKEKPLKEFSEQYRTHMFHIHQIFLTDLRPENKFITSTIVQKYVNELHTTLLMYCLNYQMRKRNVDTIKSTF
jgi:hypothetical protein